MSNLLNLQVFQNYLNTLIDATVEQDAKAGVICLAEFSIHSHSFCFSVEYWIDSERYMLTWINEGSGWEISDLGPIHVGMGMSSEQADPYFNRIKAYLKENPLPEI